MTDYDNSWHWMDDGEDHLESLSCPVLIEADVLRRLIAEGKQDGMRQALEWVEAFASKSPEGEIIDIFLTAEVWQAKLTAWRIII